MAMVAVGLTAASMARFVVPALGATDGSPPAPLDDVFIHFDFARSAAAGHPFEWIAGQGYSSGETAPLYAFVLALGAFVGFRGASLGVFAGAVAFASVVSAMGSLRQIVRQRVPWFVGAVLVSGIGVVAWSLWSGMETALYVALLLRALVFVRRSRLVAEVERVELERAIALMFTLLVLTRPESPVLVAPMALFVARGARRPWRSLVRTAAAPALATVAIALLNRERTGSWASAGAELKLVWSNPGLDDFERSREFVVNMAHAFVKVFVTGVTPSAWLAFVFPSLALSGLFWKRTRGFVALLLSSALLWTLLVSWNGAARFQNFRYYVPAVVLVVVAAAVSVSAFGARRRLRGVGFAWGGFTALLAVISASHDVEFFRDASGNVHDQQVEVGVRLGRLMADRDLVLVGDAGAIPYFSRRHAIDALGLGGYRRMPFVTAARYGEIATIELIERLRPSERPTHFALYPNWFGTLTSSFGVEVDHVSLERNVICGGATKGIYLADWSSLDSSGAASSFDATSPDFDELDVADVVSEREHEYVEPPFRGAGLAMARLALEGNPRNAIRFDGARVVTEGTKERFRLRTRGRVAHARIHLRTDEVLPDQRTIARGPHSESELMVEGAPDLVSPGSWRTLAGCLGPLEPGDLLEIEAVHGTYRDFHLFITNDPICAR